MFGSLLAHADKKVRDQALEALANYISTNDLQELEWLKLWKGLYYCYWMSDKSKIQLELAKKISKLIWKLKDSLKIFAFLKGYFQTLAREWNGIDSRRLDKFYSLSRQIFKEILTISAKEPGLVSGFSSLLRQGFFDNSNPKLPLGLLYHSTEAFVEEMIHVENYDVAWIEMYYGMFSTKDLVLYNRLLEVFEKIFKAKFELQLILQNLEKISTETKVLDAKSLKDLVLKGKLIFECKETQRKLKILKKRKSMGKDTVKQDLKKSKILEKISEKKSVKWSSSIKQVKLFNKKVSISLPSSAQPKVNLKAPIRSILVGSSNISKV